MTNNTRLIQGDCLKILPSLIEEDIQVDLILTDPPYGTINGLALDGYKNRDITWDNTLPTKEIFDYCEKLLRMGGGLLLFSQEPYTSHLRQYDYPNLPFSYPLYWLKDHFANSLSCKKAPVSYIEDISLFRKKYDLDNKHPLREYSTNLLKELGVTYKDIEKRLGHRRAEHFFYPTSSSQWGLCTENTYNELINVYHINELSSFKSYTELKQINEKYKTTFNLPVNEKYKSNVLKYKKSYNHYHPTEKPVPLLEDLIQTYTNKGDIVLDFTMGSGSTGVACKNLNRKFIGIELNKEYYTIAKKRIKDTQTRLI
jgi:site-specific DNA-methyltransferase (adenine-specific)